jgi:hypothetical protein
MLTPPWNPSIRFPPGSRRVLPLPSPLRTGREGFPSSGSSPEPVERRSINAFAEIVPYATEALPCHRGSVDRPLSMSYLRVHCWLRWAFGPFSGRIHRLTSPKVRTFHVFSPVRTRWKSAPFRVRYPRTCGPIRSVTRRRSLFPASHTLCSIPLPYGRDTTYGGSRGLTQLSMKKNMTGTVGVCTPVGFMNVAAPSAKKAVLPTYLLVMAYQPLWPFALHEVLR